VPAHAEAVEAVSEILSRVGYNGIAVDLPVEGVARSGADHVVKAYVVYDRVARVRVRRVKEALGHLQAFGVLGMAPIGEVRLRAIEDEDWLESWKASITPLRVGAFLVRPTWWVEPAGTTAPDDAIVLLLDPGMAFGTGLHPTTQQCLEGLSTMAIAGRSVLDVGTGSGILSIAAAKRAAGRVVAVDTDELAVAAARENATRNGVAIEVSRGSAADVDGSFDVVLANIVAPVLRDIAPDLRARLAPGGTLVVAGIVGDAEAGVREALGLRLLERDQRDDWVRLTLAG
jgi:ribosomal protein L11 methyltransferase